MLSLKALISSTSNLTETQGTAAISTTEGFEKIGSGTCGTILTIAGSNTIFKMAKHDTDALTGDVFNDFKMHTAVLAAMNTMPDRENYPHIPVLGSYIPATHQTWWNIKADFCAAASNLNIDTPCATIQAERIPPLPARIRSRLIDHFCPERLRAAAHQDPSNKACLVRPYLGGHRAPDGPRKKFFSLRNYKLYLSQMLDLGVDVRTLTKTIAGALAVMHWKARIDAKDVEFALGSSRTPTLHPLPQKPNPLHTTEPDRELSSGPISPLHGHPPTTTLWLLDFNLCSTITMDDSGIDTAIQAYFHNDPYYPRPLQDDPTAKELWNLFVCRYIEVSDGVLAPTPELAELPRRFIAGVIAGQRERDSRKADRQSSFIGISG